MMKNTSVLVCDDHPVVRAMIRSYLKQKHETIEIFELDNISSIFKELKSNNYSHLILDLKLKDGNIMEVLPDIRKFYPFVKILVFSYLPKAIYYPFLYQFHLFDYVEKSIDTVSLELILEDFVSNPIKYKIVKVFPENPFSKMSSREFEVLTFLIKGLSLKAIAGQLNVHYNTISTYKIRILEKTNSKSMKELVDLCTLWKVD